MSDAVLGGRQPTKGVVGSFLVVVHHPPVRLLADVVQVGEQMSVKHLFPEGTVEALDVGILVRLAGLNVLDGHATALGPSGECLAQKLRAVVRAHHLRQAVVALELSEHAHQTIGIGRGVDLDVQGFPVEVGHHVEGPQPPPAGGALPVTPVLQASFVNAADANAVKKRHSRDWGLRIQVPSNYHTSVKTLPRGWISWLPVPSTTS